MWKSSCVPRQLARVAVATLFIVFVIVTWRRFGDLYLDTGVVLYGPWQVILGRVPYRDFEWLYGPFSLYWNALWYKLFGVRDVTLMGVNVALAAATVAASYHYFERAWGTLTALGGAWLLLTCFVFSHTTKVGNYNYVLPYSSEQLHGMQLALLATWATQQALAKDGRRRWWFVAGIACGCAFLAKAEMFPAAILPVLAGVGLYFAEHVVPKSSSLACLSHEDACSVGKAEHARRSASSAFVSVIGGFLFPVCTYASYAFGVMDPKQALLAVVGAWKTVFTPAAKLPWNLETMGLDDISGNLGRLGLGFGISVAVVLAIGLFGRLGQQRHGRISFQRALEFGAIGGLIVLGMRFEHWELPIRTFPLIAVGSVVGAAVWLWKNRENAKDRGELIALALWSLFALGAILRMILDARIRQYGFTQAMPATLLLVPLLVIYLPRTVVFFRSNARVVQRLGLALVFALGIANLGESWGHLQRKNTPIEFGRVSLKTYDDDPRTKTFVGALRYLSSTVAEDETLLVIPEGALLNFILDRRNPARFCQLTPTEVTGFGEKQILEDFRRNSPKWVVLVHKYTVPKLFGESPEYGSEILAWVRGNYRVERLFGEEPLRTPRSFGIQVWKRLN